MRCAKRLRNGSRCVELRGGVLRCAAWRRDDYFLIGNCELPISRAALRLTVLELPISRLSSRVALRLEALKILPILALLKVNSSFASRLSSDTEMVLWSLFTRFAPLTTLCILPSCTPFFSGSATLR